MSQKIHPLDELLNGKGVNLSPKCPAPYAQYRRCIFRLNRPFCHPPYASPNRILRISCSISVRFIRHLHQVTYEPDSLCATDRTYYLLLTQN
jgi:hypothetical protein